MGGVHRDDLAVGGEPIGAPHTFTITATRTDGDPVGGATISYTWSGTDPPTPPSPCTTNRRGVYGDGVVVGVGGGDVDGHGLTDGTFTVDLTAGRTDGWAAHRISRCRCRRRRRGWRTGCRCRPPATNLVGVPHTFTATVQQTGWRTRPSRIGWRSPDGTTLTATSSGSRRDRHRGVDLRDDGHGRGYVHVRGQRCGRGDVDVDGDRDRGHDRRRDTVTDLPVPPVETTKTWVAYTVTVSPSATNPAGAAHTFTITATRERR